MNINVYAVFVFSIDLVGYGVTSDGFTTFINASTCTRRYIPKNPAIVFDMTIPDGHNKEELLHVEKDS